MMLIISMGTSTTTHATLQTEFGNLNMCCLVVIAWSYNLRHPPNRFVILQGDQQGQISATTPQYFHQRIDNYSYW